MLNKRVKIIFKPYNIQIYKQLGSSLSFPQEIKLHRKKLTQSEGAGDGGGGRGVLADIAMATATVTRKKSCSLTHVRHERRSIFDNSHNKN